jgi:transcriptional regulator with XRE-family HTH domain
MERAHPMTSQNGRAFNEWLRGQLKAKKMSQRQLAQQSGVDHSTISRLIRGDRMPSLGTATKLARGLRELRDDADTPAYLGMVTSGTTNPTARVEYALRADDLLSEPQVRQIMEYYLAVRMRRYGRSYQGDSGATASGQSVERTPDHALRPTSTVTTSVTSAHPVPGSSRPFAGGVETTGSAISTIATVRPVARSASREPGRY